MSKFKITTYKCECGNILGEPYGCLHNHKMWVHCDSCDNEYEVDVKSIEITNCSQSLNETKEEKE